MSRKRTLTARLTVICLSAVLLFSLRAHALMPHTTQSISLTNGWNAIYVEVRPEQAPDDLFDSWPVDHVGLYDPASFLATRQFSAEWNSQGLPREAMAVWYRGVPEASSLKSVPAGSVLVTFCKDEIFFATLYGAPAAPRMTWHVTDTNTVYNFVGFSVSNATDIAAYLEGSPCENIKSLKYYRVGGKDPNAVPNAREVLSFARTVNNGDVLLLPSDKISDWSGPLYVSPLNGVNFGQSANKSSLSIRNDGKASREVRVELAQADNRDELFRSPNLLYAIMYRDMDAVFTNAAWEAFGKAVYKTLAPGETWKLEFGLQRSELQKNETRKGLPFGALLKVSEDGASQAKVVVPIYGETSGETATDWRTGLWVADVELDTVRMVDLARFIATNQVEGVQVVTTNVVETALSEKSRTGGKFKLRLPIHCDREGRLRLLQRVVTAGSTDADGTFHYKLYAGTAQPPDTDTTLMRISAVCLPTETPVIEASEGDLLGMGHFRDGWFKARFEFTVAPNGATSLLRHPYHPQHDGLRWDFQTRAPDGDDVYNYASDVKPETFSVKSEIKLSIVSNEGAAEWNPSESFDGTCEWVLSGLRHDGDVVVSGPLSLKHVSSNAQLILE